MYAIKAWIFGLRNKQEVALKVIANLSNIPK